MSRLRVQEDSRAPYGLPIALVDLRSNKILSCSRSVADAERHRKVLLSGGALRQVADPQRFADVEGRCFPISTGEEALRSWTDIRQARLRYSPTEFAGLIATVQGALLHYLNVAPVYRQDDPDDDLEDPDDDPTGQLGDDEDDDDDFDDDPDADYGDNAAYSLPHVTMLGKPRDGELEQRRPWPPAIAADRRRY
jgi:hypothetical protein